MLSAISINGQRSAGVTPYPPPALTHAQSARAAIRCRNSSSDRKNEGFQPCCRLSQSTASAQPVSLPILRPHLRTLNRPEPRSGAAIPPPPPLQNRRYERPRAEEGSGSAGATGALPPSVRLPSGLT